MLFFRLQHEEGFESGVLWDTKKPQKLQPGQGSSETDVIYQTALSNKLYELFVFLEDLGL